MQVFSEHATRTGRSGIYKHISTTLCRPHGESVQSPIRKVGADSIPPGTSVSKLERANFKEKVHHKLEKSKVKRDTGGPGSLLRYLCTRSVRAVAVNTVTHEHDVEHEQTVGFLMLRCEDNKDE